MPTPTGAPVLPLPALLRPREVRLQIADGTEAVYMVREQLASLNFPSDAVGVTKAVTGSIVVGPNNAIQADRSTITVDLRTLKSDDGRRDRYIQRSTLDTQRFPYIEFVPKEVVGLAWPLPTAGEAQFTVAGDMALHGVVRSITWEVTAQFSPDQIVGRATTNFRFAEFGMTVPRVFVVLSVEDSIRLRLDFQLARAGE
jgi:polyisoprenoid-binding protein YceI